MKTRNIGLTSQYGPGKGHLVTYNLIRTVKGILEDDSLPAVKFVRFYSPNLFYFWSTVNRYFRLTISGMKDKYFGDYIKWRYFKFHVAAYARALMLSTHDALYKKCNLQISMFTHSKVKDILNQPIPQFALVLIREVLRASVLPDGTIFYPRPDFTFIDPNTEFNPKEKVDNKNRLGLPTFQRIFGILNFTSIAILVPRMRVQTTILRDVKVESLMEVKASFYLKLLSKKDSLLPKHTLNIESFIASEGFSSRTEGDTPYDEDHDISYLSKQNLAKRCNEYFNSPEVAIKLSKYKYNVKQQQLEGEFDDDENQLYDDNYGEEDLQDIKPKPTVLVHGFSHLESPQLDSSILLQTMYIDTKLPKLSGINDIIVPKSLQMFGSIIYGDRTIYTNQAFSAIMQRYGTHTYEMNHVQHFFSLGKLDVRSMVNDVFSLVWFDQQLKSKVEAPKSVQGVPTSTKKGKGRNKQKFKT